MSALPERLEWEFRNITQAAYFWPTLDSIGISDDQDDLATFSCEVVDEDESLTFLDEDRIRVRHNGVSVFEGHIKTLTRRERSEMGPRSFAIEAQDYTAKLDDSVIDHERAFPAESLADRIDRILSYLNYPITTTHVNLPSEDCDKGEFDGMTVREALDQEADEHRLSLYVDFDRDLHLFRTETITAPWTLDDESPDFVGSFPYREWEHGTDSVELANAVYVQGEKASSWVTDAPSIAAYGRQERTVSDEDIVTANQRANFGARALAQTKDPQVEGHFTLEYPGLRAGMTILLSNDLFGFSEAVFIVTHVDVEAVDPADDDGKSWARYNVTYSDRRVARPRRKPRKPPRDAGAEDGASVTLARYCYTFAVGRLAQASAFHYESIPDEVDFAGPGGPIHREITQNSNPHNIPWTAGVCALSSGGWGGHAIEEQWFEATLGSLSGVIGLRLLVTLTDAEGQALVDGTEVVIGVSPDQPEPYSEADFSEAARIPAQDGVYEAFIPASLLTPSATNYIVLAAGWRCIPSPGSWTCINDEPGIGDVVGNGLYMSGGVTVDAITAHEAVLSGSGMTDWVSVEGQADGDNRVFDLIDWNGKGRPQARIGAVVQGYPADFDFDDDTGEVTFRVAPPAGSAVAFRYRT